MMIQFVCSATPSPFQPQPEKTQPRSHSVVVHAAATKSASVRFVVDFSQGERGRGRGAVPPAEVNIFAHLSSAGLTGSLPGSASTASSRGLASPQNQAKAAK